MAERCPTKDAGAHAGHGQAQQRDSLPCRAAGRCSRVQPNDHHTPLRLHVLPAVEVRAMAELARAAAPRKGAGPRPRLVGRRLRPWRRRLLAVAIVLEAAPAHVKAGHVLPGQQASPRRLQALSRAAAAARQGPLQQPLLLLQQVSALACSGLPPSPLCTKDREQRTERCCLPWAAKALSARRAAGCARNPGASQRC